MMQGLYACLLVHLLTWVGQNARGSQIIDGKKVPKDSMQYMVSVQSSNGHLCGGFLVNEEFVVTAAHCDKPDLTHVVLGTHNLKKVDNDTMRRVIKKCKPKSYEKPGSGHDIMLLKLSGKARVGNRVKPIQLSADNKIRDNQKCSVAGWGYTRTGGKPVDVLQVVDVPIVNLDVCRRKWQRFSSLPDNIICAGGYETKKGFCKGDSGGPLVCNEMAVGVVSFNLKKNCDYPNVPNIYTDISKYLPWINTILKKKQC